MGALEEFDEWCRLRGVVRIEIGESGAGSLGGFGELELQGLGLHWADEVQADGGGEQAAEMVEEKGAGSGVGGDAKASEDMSEGRSEVRMGWGCPGAAGSGGKSAGGRTGGWLGEDAAHGAEEGSALKPAGSIGDVIGQERVILEIEVVERTGGTMGREDERQGAASGLNERVFEKGPQRGPGGDFTVLEGGFESA